MNTETKLNNIMYKWLHVYNSPSAQVVIELVEMIYTLQASNEKLRDALKMLRQGIENEEENGLWCADDILMIINEALADTSRVPADVKEAAREVVDTIGLDMEELRRVENGVRHTRHCEIPGDKALENGVRHTRHCEIPGDKALEKGTNVSVLGREIETEREE